MHRRGSPPRPALRTQPADCEGIDSTRVESPRPARPARPCTPRWNPRRRVDEERAERAERGSEKVEYLSAERRPVGPSVCLQQLRIYIRPVKRGVSAMYKDREYAFLCVPIADTPSLHAHDAVRPAVPKVPAVECPTPPHPTRGWRPGRQTENKVQDQHQICARSPRATRPRRQARHDDVKGFGETRPVWAGEGGRTGTERSGAKQTPLFARPVEQMFTQI